MERGALHVLGEAVLLGDAVGAHDAGDRRGAGEALLLHQQLQRPVAPAAGRHLVHAGLGAALVEHRPDGEALQQRAPGDVLGQLLDGDAGLDAAHVGLAEDELVEGDVARYAQGDLGLRLGHGMVLRDGPAGSLSPGLLEPVTKPLRPLPLHASPWRQAERGCRPVHPEPTSGLRVPGERRVTAILPSARCRPVAERQQIVGRLRCRRCRAHDRAIVFAQQVDPGADVVGMPHGRHDAERSTNEGCSNLGAQFLLDVWLRPERSGEVACEPVRGTTPVR